MTTRPRSVLVMTLLGLALGGCAPGAGDPEGQERLQVRRIAEAQIRRHPEAGPEDLYKLLHQAAMGSEHAMTDTAGVRAWMTRELATMGAGQQEPMIDTIAPGGAVVRVHLRPWVAAGRSTDSLVAAFMKTATTFAPDTARLTRYLAAGRWAVERSATRFTVDRWSAYTDSLRTAGYPAIHHSDGYERAYHPAYRVVAGSLVP